MATTNYLKQSFTSFIISVFFLNHVLNKSEKFKYTIITS